MIQPKKCQYGTATQTCNLRPVGSYAEFVAVPTRAQKVFEKYAFIEKEYDHYYCSKIFYLFYLLNIF